jgi:hypothetical protein
MISLGLDWTNLHGQPHTLVTSMRSYAWCDPTNPTWHIRYGWLIATTKRYLLPL